ncbi:hypothetical protein NQ318_013593 [Aromia moschata]|uniref:Protein kinase domain-containing protein n=1 Tax=Aromia moschata TaxID=1265417 RepID=A0AAV8YMQ9_9CUCU|nr:hypothetical protein NQ318_013593 [Aromia moschata]
MSHELKRAMLQDLDVLIKVGKHENLIGLIGTCETSQMVCIILEYVSMNLKDLLLGSRDSLPGRFSNMSEVQALDIAIQVARGMAHLESCKVDIKTNATKSTKSKIMNLCEENPDISISKLMTAVGWESMRTPALTLTDGGMELANKQKDSK